MATLNFRQRARLSQRIRSGWYRSMATLIADGMPVQTVLDKMAREFARVDHPMAALVRELMLRLRGGGTRVASKQVRTVGCELLGLVPVNEAMLIDAGESSGDLSRGFARAAEYVEATSRLRAEMLGPLREPGLLFAMLLFILVFFSLQVLPTFAEISPRAKWPPVARLYGLLADQALLIAFLSAGLLLLGGVAFIQLAARWSGPWRYRLDRRLWPWTLVAQVNSASMLTAIAGFVSAGVPFDTAVTQLQASSNEYMKRIYGRVRESLRNGQHPHEALCALHIVDPAYHWMLRLYGESTDFSGAMSKLAREMVEFAIQKARAIFAVVNFILKILVAGFVVWTLLSMFGVVGSVRTNNIALQQAADPFLPTGAWNHESDHS